MANSAGRRRLPEPGVGRWLSARAVVAGAGDGRWVVPAQGSSLRPGAPTGAAAVQGSLLNFHPGRYVPHIPSWCRPGRRTEPPQHSLSPPLVPPPPLRCADPERKIPAGRDAGRVRPRISIAGEEPQPKRSLLQQPQPKMGSPKGRVSPAKAPPPAALQHPSRQGGLPPLSLSPVSSQFFFSGATNTFL